MTKAPRNSEAEDPKTLELARGLQQDCKLGYATTHKNAAYVQ